MDTCLVPFRHQTADGAVALKEACWLNGKPYFTRRAIGEWLEYRDGQHGVDDIVQRNPHIRQFSVPLKLRGTDGKNYEHEVYDPIGLQLIVFESRQPKAIQFKVMVAHLVAAFMRGELRPTNTLSVATLQITDGLNAIAAMPWGGRSRAMAELGEASGLSRGTLYRRKKQDPAVAFRPKGKHATPFTPRPADVERRARVEAALDEGNRIAVGTNGAAAAAGDVAPLANQWTKAFDSIDHPSANATRFNFTIAANECNGMVIREFGLLLVDGETTVLFSRKGEKSIEKTDSFAIAGRWTITIN